MTDWTEVREIFEAAYERSPAERAAYLERVCGARPEMRVEIEELLTSADSSEALEPAADGARPPLEMLLSAPEISATHIGRYRLGRVLASGGMGVVFEAEQDEPRRVVALKMMRLGLQSSASVQRFRYEAEVLAKLRHPGIAHVYDTGVHRVADGAGGDRELPWFAMEFVEQARSIVQFASDEALTIEARIRLFLRACDAVQHGHQLGVIHRDLKPDNILVDGSGALKVIDFGVARATDVAVTHRMTQTGQVVGTPQYMAPEQLGDDRTGVDVRVDVYALGLVLFELLTGHHALDFAGKSIHEIAEAVRSAPARRLAGFDPRLGSDLQVIVDTAIDRNVARRYASVSLLAEDLRRFARSDPIAARPPSVVYQLHLFARRNRGLVLSCVAILAVSVVAAAVSVHWALRSTDAERVARTEKAQATELLGLLLDDSLTALLDFEQRLAAVGETAELRRGLLREAVDRLVALESRAGDDPELLLPLVRAYRMLGNLEGNPSVRNLGDLARARQSLRHAHDLATRLAAAHPASAPIKRSLGDVTVSLASLALAEGDRAVAIEKFRVGIALLRESAGGDPLAVDLDLSRAYGHLAGVLALSDRLDEAHAAALARTEVTRRALAAAPDDATRRGNHAASTGHLGIVSFQRHEYGDALESYEEAAAMHRELFRSEGRVIDRDFHIKMRLTQVEPLWHLGRVDLAEARMEEGLRALRAVIESEPEVVNHSFQLGLAHLTFGDLYRGGTDEGADSTAAPGDWPRARDHYAQSRAVFDRLFDAGTLVPAYGRLRDLAHQRWRECEDELAP